MAPTEPTYPDTALGTIARQRDQILSFAEQDAGMAELYAEREQAGRDRANQLQVAIDAMH